MEVLFTHCTTDYREVRGFGLPLRMNGSRDKEESNVMDMVDEEMEAVDDAELNEPLDGSFFNISMEATVGTTDEFECGVCKKSYKHKTSLTRHIKVHDDRYQFKCTRCSRYFSTEEALQTHKQQKHSSSFLCIICGKTFKQKYHLANHTAMHDPEENPSKVLICPFDSCQKKFVTKAKFQDHMNVHTDVKPYTCSKCNNNFHGKYRKNEHERVCLGLIDIKCDQCGKDFTDAASRKRHIDGQHGGIVHICVCGKTYKYYSSLHRHKKYKGH